MPTIHLHRTWCKTCQDWTLHSKKQTSEGELLCRECKTEFTTVPFSEISEDKIQEQRKRYIKTKSAELREFLKTYLNPSNPLKELFREDFPKEISEDDAGQKEIDDIEYEKKQVIRKEEQIAREKFEEEKERFKILTRNDICLCGSNLKYKKCCLLKYS